MLYSALSQAEGAEASEFDRKRLHALRTRTVNSISAQRSYSVTRLRFFAAKRRHRMQVTCLINIKISDECSKKTQYRLVVC